MSLLGLDIGTTGCKAVAFNEEGDELARAYREYSLDHPKPGWVEISPQLLWLKVSEAITEANSSLAGDPVRSLAVSCQGEAVVPVSRDGKELYNFIITFDARTQPQCDWWRERVGAKKLFGITGMPLHPMYSINKIMWLRENMGDVFVKAWKFLCVEDYIIYRLTGEAATDWSLASRTMAFDVVRRDWSDEILSLAGVGRELLPAVHPSGHAVGAVRPDVAEQLGLSAKTVVATGGHDQPCGALGAGIVGSGRAMNATGTSDVVCPAFDRPHLTDAMLQSNYCCYPHTCEDQYCSIAFNLTGGLLLRWYRDTLCRDETRLASQSGRDAYEVILSGMAKEPVSTFFLPHFVGAGTPHLDPHSRGAILGLTLETRKPQLTRAVIDSVNYELKLNIDRMEQAGIGISELRAIGGGAKSAVWLQMKADVFGKPVVALKTQEAASLGAAMLAGKAIGLFPSAKAAAEALVKTTRTYQPDPQQGKLYKDKYQRYLGIYETLRKFNQSLD